jgi:hypothetical protein
LRKALREARANEGCRVASGPIGNCHRTGGGR